MKKYSFLVYHREYQDFLKDIQDLGVLHVIEQQSGEIENEELQEKYVELTKLNNAINFLEKREIEADEQATEKDGIQKLNELISLQSEQNQYEQKLSAFTKELNILEPWGEFDWENIEKLKEAGLKIRFFTTNARKYDEDIKDNFYVEAVNEVGGHTYFVLIETNNETTEIDAEELQLPQRSLSKIKELIAETEAILSKRDEVYNSFAKKYTSLLKQSKISLESDISFDKVVLNTQKQAEDKLMILEGWVPEDKIQDIESYLTKSGVFFESYEPEVDDQIPIKLKNSKFARLYEVIGELYTFPNYKELDLTPFFAPFYMLFFGFCLGDAGYGLLITIATIIGLFKAKPNVKPLMKLGMYLGIATTFMGIVGGTFFGIMLLDVDWAWVENYKSYMLGSNQLMYLALGLGYIQVIFGMFINAANKARMYGFKHAISQLGWTIIVMVTIPALGIGMATDIMEKDLAMKIALISVIIGGIPAFFYNSPGKNPLLNLGVGLWDTYQTASGLLGDVLSYIRLFALGLSSAILGNVFNTLAIDLSPDIIIVKQIVIVLILAFGHSLNFFMAALGSFVHPLRLTFVEFYKNAGFMGGGKKYEPFSK